jgi:hypothetical protein
VNEVAQLGQLAGALYPGGVAGWLEYLAVLALVASGAVVLAGGIAAARRTRRRNGRRAPGPPPGPPAPLVARAPWIPRDGELRPAEEQAFAVIAQRFRDGGRQRMAARAIGPARRIRLARRARTRARAARR